MLESIVYTNMPLVYNGRGSQSKKTRIVAAKVKRAITSAQDEIEADL